MWYLYFSIGLAAACIGIPLFLIYWTDKRSKRSFEKKNRGSDSGINGYTATIFFNGSDVGFFFVPGSLRLENHGKS